MKAIKLLQKLPLLLRLYHHLLLRLYCGPANSNCPGHIFWETVWTFATYHLKSVVCVSVAGELLWLDPNVAGLPKLWHTKTIRSNWREDPISFCWYFEWTLRFCPWFQSRGATGEASGETVLVTVSPLAEAYSKDDFEEESRDAPSAKVGTCWVTSRQGSSTDQVYFLSRKRSCQPSSSIACRIWYLSSKKNGKMHVHDMYWRTSALDTIGRGDIVHDTENIWHPYQERNLQCQDVC